MPFNHYTSPHWFAARGGWLNPDASERFAEYCARVMAAFGDRIAYAVTFNEPNLHRLLTWVAIPPFVCDLERQTIAAASATAGVDRYRVLTVVLPEEIEAIEDALARGHAVAKDAIKSHRSDLPSD